MGNEILEKYGEIILALWFLGLYSIFLYNFF